MNLCNVLRYCCCLIVTMILSAHMQFSLNGKIGDENIITSSQSNTRNAIEKPTKTKTRTHSECTANFGSQWRDDEILCSSRRMVWKEMQRESEWIEYFVILFLAVKQMNYTIVRIDAHLQRLASERNRPLRVDRHKANVNHSRRAWTGPTGRIDFFRQRNSTTILFHQNNRMIKTGSHKVMRVPETRARRLSQTNIPKPITRRQFHWQLFNRAGYGLWTFRTVFGWWPSPSWALCFRSQSPGRFDRMQNRANE